MHGRISDSGQGRDYQLYNLLPLWFGYPRDKEWGRLEGLVGDVGGSQDGQGCSGEGLNGGCTQGPRSRWFLCPLQLSKVGEERAKLGGRGWGGSSGLGADLGVGQRAVSNV